MIRIDMSDYQDGGTSVDKLIGMPRGIAGSDRGGILTNQLKDNPCSVVLLDEIEKADPRLLNLFLQAFDEGWLTDGRGKRVYLSDAIVIMTSNADRSTSRSCKARWDSAPARFRWTKSSRRSIASWNGASRRSFETALTSSWYSIRSRRTMYGRSR